jgi:hypothetical protein
MAEQPQPPLETQVQLRTPMSGMGMRDPRSAFLLWGGASIALGITITFLLILGEFRLLVLLMLGFLGLLCLSPRRGVYILTLFLPFMYFLRRSVLVFEEFSSFDPIVLFPMVMSVAIFAGLALFNSRTIMFYLRRSTTLKAAALLMGLYALQIANPLQGNLLLGLIGGLFFLAPMMWIVLGLLMKRDDIIRLFKIVLVIGVITSLYGLYQHFFGFSEVEKYELRAKDFYKLMADSAVRVMSTFSSFTDFARYLTIAGFLAFALYYRTRTWIVGLFLLGLMLYAMFWTASRTSFLVVFFSIATFFLAHARNRRQIVVQGFLLIVLVVSLYAYLFQFDPKRVYSQQFSADAFLVHTVSGMTHPLQEGSFKGRITAWRHVTVGSLWNPFGHGVGSTTHIAPRFEGGQYFEVESFFFELFYGSGILAPIFFMAIALLTTRVVIRMCLDAPDDNLPKIAFALLCGAFLSSVFGITARDFITGPLMWLVIGWLVRENVDAAVALPDVAAVPAAAWPPAAGQPVAAGVARTTGRV